MGDNYKATANRIYQVLKKAEEEHMGIVDYDQNRGCISYMTNHLIYRFICNFYINDLGDFVVSVFCLVDESEDEDETNYQPIIVDLKNETQVQEMAKFLCWINDDMKFGNFNLSSTDGTISFRYGVKCGGELPPVNTIVYCIYKPLEYFEKHEMNMKLIIDNDFTAEDVIND